MNLSSEQEAQLQDYLIGQLEPICAADPKVLSMYILALLKRDDMTTEQVREFCTTELQDFLKDETRPFIGRLFDVLQEMTSRQPGGKKELDDSRRQERRKSEEEDDRYSRRSDDSRKRRTEERERSRSPAPSSQWDDETHDRKRRRAGSEERGTSAASYSDEERERSPSRRDRHRRERERVRDTRDVQPSSATSSASRRHDPREDRVNIDRPLSSSRGKEDSRGWEGGRVEERPSSVVSSVGRHDEGRGRDWARRGGGRDSARPGDYGRITGRKRGVCYDFEERGVCVRGENCEYEHLGRPLVVDEAGLSKLQSGRDDNEDSYNPEDPFLNKTSPIPVWHGPTSRGAPPPRGGRGGGMGPGLLNPPGPMPPMPPIPHGHMPRMGGQGVLPLPPVPMPPPHQAPYGDGLMPTPGMQPYTARGRGGMRGGRGRGRGGYQQRTPYEEEGMFGHESESTITDTATLGNNSYTSHYGDNQGGGRGFNRFKRGRYEGDYGGRGARPPKPQTDSISVTRIPPELNTIDKLNEHFKKFGSIVNIQLDPLNKQAFVQFTSNAEALLALRSPEAVMGNRFIQVYLKRDEQQEGGQPPAVPQLPRPVPKPTSLGVPQPAMVAKTATSLVVQPTVPAQPKNLDALKKKKQELLSKQLEQQKKLLELLEKMKGSSSKEKDEIKAQLTALTAKIGEAMKEAREGVAKQKAAPVVVAPAHGGPASAASWKKLSAESEKQRLDRELEFLARSKEKTAVPAVETTTIINETEGAETTKGEAPAEGASEVLAVPATETTTSPPGEKEVVDESRVEALQKTLASLQEEAKKLGIPAAQIAAQVAGIPTPALRGPRGRGRGIRARGAPWWARGRGGRGRGRGFATASRSFKLDNRTTVICVYDVPEELRDESLLRAHFAAFGEIISLALQPDTNNFLVQFAQRFMAEQALQKGGLLQGHALNVNWYDSQSPADAGEMPELIEAEGDSQDVEEYVGDSFTEEQFGIIGEEEVDVDEDKEERSWKRE